MSDNRVLIDTSIWIEYFRGKAPLISAEVGRLLETDRVVTVDLVEAEMYRGACSEKEIRFLEEHFSRLPFLEVPPAIWRKVGQFSWRMARQGYLPHLIDAFIALAAIDNDALLYSNDNDFKRIAERSELRLYGS